MVKDLLYYVLIFVFVLGYLGIVFEKFLHVNKAAIALTMAVLCWFLYLIPTHGTEELLKGHFAEQVSDVAQVIFFLLAAMVIVELIDSHRGFSVITDILYSSSKRRMLWFLVGLSFFMSSVLDNLTSMIVIASLLRKMVKNKEDRWFLGSMVVIAVNAGGAWTPIGDVTTTMLWINDKITTWAIIRSLFFPSVVCAAVAAVLATFMLKKEREEEKTVMAHLPLEPGAKRVLWMGIGALVFIPIWKTVFGIPPFMGALLGLGLLWLFTDILHFRYGEERWHLRVGHVLTRIDMSGVIFFLGILLAVNALQGPGILKDFALFLEKIVPNQNYVAVLIGLLSSVVDNVPLVAATMGMYDMTLFPTNAPLWQLIAYAAGTGGSILIIGSAAGVALMGIEKIDFIWYLRKVTWIALVSYFAGLLVYFFFL